MALLVKNIMKSIFTLWRMPLSRKMQHFAFLYQGLVTKLVYRFRLKACGSRSIVQPPIFWTPEYISIGDDVLIWRGCRIEAVNKYGNQVFEPNIVIGDRVSFQQNCHITAALSLEIGSDSTILFDVLITDIDHRYDLINQNVAKQPIETKVTRIGKNCFIGSGAKIFPGTQLGDQCIVGANSVVRGIFPNYCVIAGAPARLIKRYDFKSETWRKVNTNGDFIND
jgi:acetyltransferase-like isoleucine patch superfamily enzyme